LNPLILIVDDNIDLLLNLQMTLESNDYEVLTAKNGIEAIEILIELDRLPELIISDIMMPKMNGYDLFKSLSENIIWNRIPFIFLSARDAPEDIRFGKMLGIDDYIIKPFREEDLLAIIAGKITRNRNITLINKKIEELFASLKIDITPSISDKEKSHVILLCMYWDDRYGPKLISHFPRDVNFPFKIEKVGQQLFNAITSLYGYDDITKAEGILLNIENIKMNGFIFFDSYKDDTVRGGEQQYMIGLVASKINYFESLKMKEVFTEISSKIKEKENWEMEKYWEKLSTILSGHF